MEYTIENGTLSISVSDYGAELQSVKLNKKERLWQNETGEWAGHAPVLFPYCGNFDVVVNGKKYAARPHGFCKKTEFVLEKKTENGLVFVLRSSEKTLASYPYDFEFRVEYALNGNELEVIYEVKNTGSETMPFSCGGHESFVLDGDVDEYKLVFPSDEAFVHRPHGLLSGRLTGERRLLGRGKELIIPRELLVDSATVILEKIRSGKVRLCTLSGKKLAELEFEGFPYLLLWRPSENAHMVCIEPWHNLPDAEEADGKELTEKEGMMFLSRGETKKIVRKIRYF